MSARKHEDIIGPRSLSAAGMPPLLSMFDGIRFPSAHEAPDVGRNRLPHLALPYRPIFLTFRLHDSIPAERMYTLKAERTAWLEAHPEPWSLDDEIAYHRLFSQPIFDWLDEHLGSCPLRSESARDLLRAVLGRFEEVNYRSFAWVIMPNHVHGLFALLGETLLQEQVKAWKGVSAREILRGSDGGILWQKDYFDRLIRDEQHFWRVADYIRKNPARLPAGDFWHWEHAEVTAHFNGNGGIAFGCLTAPAADSEPLRPLMQNAQHRR